VSLRLVLVRRARPWPARPPWPGWPRRTPEFPTPIRMRSATSACATRPDSRSPAATSTRRRSPGAPCRRFAGLGSVQQRLAYGHPSGLPTPTGPCAGRVERRRADGLLSLHEPGQSHGGGHGRGRLAGGLHRGIPAEVGRVSPTADLPRVPRTPRRTRCTTRRSNIHVSGDTWTAVDGGSVNCNSGTSTSLESIVLPASTIDGSSGAGAAIASGSKSHGSKNASGAAATDSPAASTARTSQRPSCTRIKSGDRKLQLASRPYPTLPTRRAQPSSALWSPPCWPWPHPPSSSADVAPPHCRPTRVRPKPP
jgi:hypothetical protein